MFHNRINQGVALLYPPFGQTPPEPVFGFMLFIRHVACTSRKFLCSIMPGHILTGEKALEHIELSCKFDLPTKCLADGLVEPP
jgi:hypothetical protein